jgi:hypothetical protein
VCEQGVCASDAGTCGAVGAPCCGTTCTAGNAVCGTGDASDSCVACGGAGELCCGSAGNRSCTAAGTACSGDTAASTCVTCGIPGNPCCPGNLCTGGGCCTPGNTYGTCIAADTDCPDNDGVCQAGVCVGDAGPCGGSGDPCCARTTGGPFCTADKLTCPPATGGGTRTCAACGASTQRCCRGSVCNTGLTCSGGTGGGTCG